MRCREGTTAGVWQSETEDTRDLTQKHGES